MMHYTRKKVALVTVLALLFSTIFPFFASASVANAAISSSDTELHGVLESADTSILICTSSGIKWVSKAEFSQGNYESAEHKQSQCILCFVAASQAQFATLSYADGNFALRSAIRTITHYDISIAPSFVAYRTDSPRAPPATI